MRYEHINRVCRCNSTSTYIFKGVITRRDILDKMDTICSECLKEKCDANCTGMDEWEPLTEELYNKRMHDYDKRVIRTHI